MTCVDRQTTWVGIVSDSRATRATSDSSYDLNWGLGADVASNHPHHVSRNLRTVTEVSGIPEGSVRGMLERNLYQFSDREPLDRSGLDARKD